MQFLAILGLLLAIAVMVVGAYRGLTALPLTMLAAMVVVLTNGMPLWESFAGFYIGGFVGTLKGYLLIFMFSALYAKFMDISGSATAIGYWLIDRFGKGNVALLVVLIGSILTYGGVSLFVCIFAVGPIAFLLYREANLPRHLIVASLAVAGSTYTMTALPGVTQLTNIIPTKYLGTTLTAAPVLGILASIAMFVLGMVYINKVTKAAVARGEGWSDVGLTTPFTQAKREDLPKAWKAFLPIVVLIVFILVGSQFIPDPSLITVSAMILGAILCLLLNLDKFKGKDMKSILGIGLTDGITAIVSLAAVIGFGTVVQNSGGFTSVVQWVLGLSMHPYWQGVFGTAVISGVTGSSSGGLQLTLEALGPSFTASGCNMSTLHRLICIAAGSLDTLPHASGIFLTYAYLGVTHKEAYRHHLWTTVLIPAAVCVVATVVCIAMGI